MLFLVTEITEGGPQAGFRFKCQAERTAYRYLAVSGNCRQRGGLRACGFQAWGLRSRRYKRRGPAPLEMLGGAGFERAKSEIRLCRRL